MAHDIQDRAAGALMGAFIGDAMGVGLNWYYSLPELRRDYCCPMEANVR